MTYNQVLPFKSTTVFNVLQNYTAYIKKSAHQITCHTMWSLWYVEVLNNPQLSKVMTFSNKCLLLSFSWERVFSMGICVTEFPWATKSMSHIFIINLSYLRPFQDKILNAIFILFSTWLLIIIQAQMTYNQVQSLRSNSLIS